MIEFEESLFDAEPDLFRFFYRDRRHQQGQHEKAVELAGDLSGKSILDVGCGYGDLIHHLPADIAGYVGIDLLPWAVNEARRLHPGREFRVTRRCPEADVVFSVATLQQCRDHPGWCLQLWWRAARERLVVVSVRDWKMSWADHGVDPWLRMPKPDVVYESPDDWFVAVLEK